MAFRADGTKEGRQQGKDGDDDQQFDQGECGAAMFVVRFVLHGLVISKQYTGVRCARINRKGGNSARKLMSRDLHIPIHLLLLTVHGSLLTIYFLLNSSRISSNPTTLVPCSTDRIVQRHHVPVPGDEDVRGDPGSARQQTRRELQQIGIPSILSNSRLD